MDPPLALDVTKPIQNRCRQELLFDGKEATRRVSFGEEIKDLLGGQGITIMENIGAENRERPICVGMGHALARCDGGFERGMVTNQHDRRRRERSTEFHDSFRRERRQQLRFDHIRKDQGVKSWTASAPVGIPAL